MPLILVAIAVGTAGGVVRRRTRADDPDAADGGAVQRRRRRRGGAGRAARAARDRRVADAGVHRWFTLAATAFTILVGSVSLRRLGGHLRQAPGADDLAAGDLPRFPVLFGGAAALAGRGMLHEIRTQTRAIALGLGVVGLLNVQFAVAGDGLYIIEANPRASRTVPFVSKATGAAGQDGLPDHARRAASPTSGFRPRHEPSGHVSVKEAVLPFDRFAGADAAARPRDALDRRGHGHRAATSRPRSPRPRPRPGRCCPQAGTVFITVTDADKPARSRSRRSSHDLGFRVVATRGTAQAISRMGVPVTTLNKIGEGSPNVVDWHRARRRRPGDQHARSAPARAPTATRSAAPPSGAASPASPRCRAGSPPRERSRRRGRRAARGALAPGDPARVERPAREALSEPRTLAPFGRRRADGRRRARRSGAYRLLRCADRGPRSAAGAVLHARRGRAVGGGEDERPYLPRAFSYLRRVRASSSSCSRTWPRAPATRRAGAPATTLVLGPLGRGFDPPRRGARARCSSAGA